MTDGPVDPMVDPALLDDAARRLRARPREDLPAGIAEYAAHALARLLEELAVAERRSPLPEHVSGAAAEIALHLEHHA